MLSDLVIHGWDLARGAGLDETLEPAAAVAPSLAYLEPNAKSWEAGGHFCRAGGNRRRRSGEPLAGVVGPRALASSKRRSNNRAAEVSALTVAAVS